MDPEEISNIEIYMQKFILKWQVFVLYVTSVNVRSVQVSHHAGIVHSKITDNATFNSLALGGCDYSLRLVNFKLISAINILSIFYSCSNSISNRYTMHIS